MTSAMLTVLRRNLREALRHQDLTQAALLLDRLTAQDPLAVETRGLELELLLRRKDDRAAKNLAKQLLALFPASSRVQFLAGQVAYRHKNYGLAIARFRESLGLYPSALTQRWLARALCQAGEFDEAEALFVGLQADRPRVALDLAWLYERMQQFERAVVCLERYLADTPHDQYAQSQQARLRARLLQPAHLQEEVETLVDLGEEIAPEVLPQYVDALFQTGKAAQARHFITEQNARWPARLAEQVGWACHRAQAYDLALELFLRNLTTQRRNFKFLSALETCALRCARTPELIERYAEQAASEPSLYGRIRKLERRSGSSQK